MQLVRLLEPPSTASSFSLSADLSWLIFIRLLLRDYHSTGNAWGAAVSGNYAYVVDKNNGLVILGTIQ